MDHPRPWLRYVDAEDLERATVKLHGLDVESSSGERLGNVDGFVVDSATGRPYYVAVDAGGWFTSKLFLLPIGHVGFDRERRLMTADLTRERVKGFPGFDPGEFEKLSDDELMRMDEQIVASCCPAEIVDRSTGASRFDRWRHYKSPTWWDAHFLRPDRADRNLKDIAGVTMPSREEVRAQRDGESRRSMVHDTGTKKTVH